jgi:hypothetical protein
MNKLKQVGKNTLATEVTSMSPFGVWIYLKGREYFLDYDDFPWFKDSNLRKVMNVKLLSENHLYWPDLDVDLHVESIKNPKAFPLIVSRGN